MHKYHVPARVAAAVGAVGLVWMGAATPVAAQGRSLASRVFTLNQDGDSRIGVTIEDVADNDAVDEGAMVNDVRSDSPAESAGFASGDVIVEFDGERVRSARQLTRLVQETPAGRTVGAAVLRDGDRVELEVTPEPATATVASAPSFGRLPDGLVQRFGSDDRDFTFGFVPGGRPRLGASVQELTPQLADYFGVDDGVLVTAVDDGSVAAAAGLQAGDVITSVDERAIDDVETLRRRLSAFGDGDELALGVTRSGRDLDLTATFEGQTRNRTRSLFRRQGI